MLFIRVPWLHSTLTTKQMQHNTEPFMCEVPERSDSVESAQAGCQQLKEESSKFSVNAGCPINSAKLITVSHTSAAGRFLSTGGAPYQHCLTKPWKNTLEENSMLL